MKNKLLAILIILFAGNSFAQDPAWVKENTWYFDNFKKDTLPWSIFRETYIGVAPAPAVDFDALFYDLIYQTELAKAGHCHGMCVMAMLMMKNGGHLGYCHPPYMYTGEIREPDAGDTTGPSDPNLRTAIAITHGTQLNHGFLSFLLDLIAIGKNRDGRHAFQQVVYYLAKNDPPVISVTQSLSPADGGHVLIPFFTEDLGATKKIYVYDPNRTYYKPGADGKEFYEGRNNFILVNNSTGTWSYNMGSETWTGSPDALNGGNCIVMPISIVGRKDRLPQSLLAEGAYAINTIFIFGEDVKLEQVTDPGNQRRLMNDARTGWETREDKRLKNVLPFIPAGIRSTAKKSSNTTVYFARGTRALDLQIRARGPYRIGLLFGGKYIEYKGTGNGNIRHIRTPGRIPVKKQPAHQLRPQINIFNRLH